MSKGPLTPEAARGLVLGEVEPLPSETVALAECLGRVTAAEVQSAIPIQPFDNSAMDGYALRAADAVAGARLRLVGESRAGHPATVPVGEGEAVWISTGAMVPDGADAVLPLEDSREEDGELQPARSVQAGEHIRRAGEDVQPNQVLLEAGKLIAAPELAVLAAAGVAELECTRRPRVAILGSGDELIPPGEPLGPGQIHDSNTHALTALVREAGATPVQVAHLPDQPEATRQAIQLALKPLPAELHQIRRLQADEFDAVRGVDVLLVAGGVSVGRHDHVKEALAALGVEERFWRVAMRPGGPTWFGVLERDGARPTLVFGLPGNPVSAMVTFQLFAKPALWALTGLDPRVGRTEAILAATYRKKPGKTHFLRCRLELTAAGWRAHLTRESQGSHILTSMLEADALAAIPAEAEEVSAGERVEVDLMEYRA